MSECLVTKLKTTVDNNSLAKIGEVSIIQADANVRGYFIINSSSSTVYTSDGNSHLYENSSDSMYSTTEITGSIKGINYEPGNYTIYITNKYNITEFVLYNVDGSDGSYFAGIYDLTQLYYCNNIVHLRIVEDIDNNGYTYKSYDVAKLLNNKNITNINLTLYQTQVDVSDIVSNINAAPSVFNLTGRGIYGDMSALSSISFSNLTTQQITFNDTYLSGDITVLDKISLSTVNKIALDGSAQHLTASRKVSDDILITGDLSTLSSNIKYCSARYYNTSFTWENTRTGYAISIRYGNTFSGDYLRAFLINQAACDLSSPLNLYGQTDNNIDVCGSYDSTDAEVATAIQTIKDAGWNITINGVAM